VNSRRQKPWPKGSARSAIRPHRRGDDVPLGAGAGGDRAGDRRLERVDGEVEVHGRPVALVGAGGAAAKGAVPAFFFSR
jgi:hypothetical protein